MATIYGLEDEYTPGCCGVRQLCGFSDPDEADHGSYRGTYPELFKVIRDDLAKGIVYHIWFYKAKQFDGDHNDEFEAAELRELVQTLDGVLCLGSTINPNSGNIIEGYQWIAK